MNFVKSFLFLLFSFHIIISCGGNSSYPTTSSSSSSSGGSSTTITDLSVSSFDNCQYYGLSVGTSASTCNNFISSNTVDISSLRASSNGTVNSDSNVGGSGDGFVGANNVLQIAEAQALLSALSKTTDGTGSNIAILGSGVNKLSSSNLNTNTTNNYGYLYLDSSNNVETNASIKTASNSTKYLDDLGTLSNFGNASYSIYNKNSLEAYSPDQALNSVNNITFNVLSAPYSNVLVTNKYSVSNSGNVSLFLYNVASSDTGVSFTDNHITSMDSFFNTKYADGDDGFDKNTFDYSTVSNTANTTFCNATNSPTCTKTNTVFFNGITANTNPEVDSILDSWFYQYSIFEYSQNDVANGTALAAIIGTTDDDEIQGAASGAEINSYKTQMYHRKLMEVQGTNFMSDMDGTFMDNVLEDNTGQILYNALNAAQADNTVVLLNNQYRNYAATLNYVDTDTSKTTFTTSYSAADPTSLTNSLEFDVYMFRSNVVYTGANSIGNDAPDDSSDSTNQGTFAAGNFASDFAGSDIYSSNAAYSNSGTYKYLNDTDVKSAYTSKVQEIANLLRSDDNTDSNNNIYVIPTDNSFFMDLINDSSYFGSNVNADHIIAVADVVVDSITYAETDTVDLDSDGTDDYDNAYAINAIVIDSKISTNDCSKRSNTSMACFIAPGNVASYNNAGTYSLYSNLDTNTSSDGIDQGEYLGSAYVTSAVSILTAAFPTVSMENIVDKLIATAIPVAQITGCVGDGASGSINCGDGMINLFKAVQSTYTSYSSTSVYSHIDAPALHTSSFAGNFAYNLADTSISTSLYFGDAFSVNAGNILAKAKYFDSYNFDYSANLNSKVDTMVDLSASRFSVSDYFSFDDELITSSEVVSLNNNISFSVTNSEAKSYESNDGKARIFENPDADLSNTSFSNLSFNQNLTKNIELSMGFDAYDANADIIGSNYANFGSLAFSANNEYAGLVNENSSYTSLSFNFAKNMQTQIGFAFSEVSDTNYLYSKLNYDLGRSLVSFSLGTLIEENNFLGTESEGAFNFDGGTKTSYYGIGYVKNMTNDIDFIAKLDFGISKIESDAYSVFRNFSDVTSRETSFALVKRANNSSYGIAYTEPMRVISGDVLVSVATARDLDGNVTLASERVSLVSSGKERNYELFFKRELSNNDSLTFNYLYSTEPNHIATNPDEQLFAINFSKTF
jgi:hypothetical protein